MAISLIEQRVPHETTLVDLQNKPDSFKSVYAKACGDHTLAAKVPILETEEDGVLIESMVILEYLDDKAADDSLTPAERARARKWATLVPSWLSWFSILRADAGSDEEANAVAKVRDGLRAMDRFLADGGDDGPFVLGARFSTAEAATAPFSARLMLVLPAVRPALAPSSWLDEDGLTRVAEWVEAVTARQSVVDTLPPAAELAQSYERLLERFKSAA